ncbi:ATPase [Phormidesmis priestleyi ULC007]|uniref:ATPase n=1 Tax=Phormidesmis priestleyi ULC007 TaxID=1920490 RepID=A0A2T1DCI9_9CYAN|nr:TrkH family potassium uptake protein [Phormidesmis priestleyi]PSB18220.1 ATPase [Phormidesmis priestleyi ULC007]PZO49491.1 MAG: ATPase [Phormidesmis priestleyi]
MTVSRTICLGFLAVITTGTLLLMMPFSLASGAWSNPVVALFTSTSAVCVTGLSVVDVGKFYSFWGQFLIVLLVQVGGLGYMTATTVLLLLLGRRLGLRDKVAIQQSLDIPGLSGLAMLIRSIIATTLIFELTGVFLLMLIFVPQFGFNQGLWLSIFHSVNAFNNAGFSLFSDNLIQYAKSPLMNGVITLLIIFGGIGYQVIMEMFFWGRDRVSNSDKRSFFTLNFKIALSTTLVLLAIGTLAFLATESRNVQTLGALGWGDQIMAAWFQSVVPRTAGFNTIDISKMTNAGLFITIALMFIGANPGGTGGGIKTTTFRVLISSTKAVLQGKDEVLCYHRQIPVPLILKAVGVLVGSAMTVIGGTILITLTDPELDFINILFEVVSAFATVGLSAVGTPNISSLGQIVLIGTMYVGRVGILLLVGALLGDPKPSFVNYPEENLLVG